MYPKNLKREIGIGCIVLILLLVCFFYKSVFQGKILLSSDNIFYIDKLWESYRPANFPPGPQNHLLVDQTHSFYPWRYFTTQSLRNGQIPLWNPYNGCGMPLIGNMTSAVFDPFNFISFLFIPLYYQNLFVVFFRLLVAGLGTYFYTRLLGLRIVASIFSALSFTFCGFMVVWLGHPQVGVACWLPFLFYFVEKLVISYDIRYAIFFALIVCFQFLAGHIETSLHILSAVSLYFVFRLVTVYISEKKYKHAILLFFLFALSGVAGFLLAGIQLFPFLEYLPQCAQYFERTYYMQPFSLMSILGNWSTFPRLLPTLYTTLFPNIFGNPLGGNYFFTWILYINYIEQPFYFGILPFFLALLTVVQFVFLKKQYIHKEHYPFILFFILLSVVSIGLALDSPFFNFINQLPIFRFALNKRFRLLFCFSGSILAGFGLYVIQEHFQKKDISLLKSFKNILRKYLFLSVTLYILIVFSVFSLAYFVADFRPYHQTIIHGMRLPSLVILVFLLFSIGLILDKVKIRLYLISVFAITVFELFYYGIRFNPTVSRDNFYPVVDPIKFLQSNLNYERVAAIGDIFIPQVNMLYGIQDIRSCDPMRIASFDRWQQKVLDRDVGWGTLIRLKHINTTVLDWLNIKYLITSQNNSTVDTNILTLVYQKNGICIYENKRRFPRAFIVSYSDITVLDYPDKPNEKNIVLKNYSFNNSTNPIVHSMVFENVQIEHYGANKVVMNTQSSQAGYLFLSDTYYPGWTAKIDNHSVSIHRAMDAFRAIEIPAGEHRVVFEYKPLSFTIGWITSLLTFVLLAVLYIFFSPKKLSSLIDNKKI